MISTAGYYCDRGHTWETTASTIGHDAELSQPCVYCVVEEEAPVPGEVHGPFSSRDAAEHVMKFRESEKAGPNWRIQLDESREET